MTEQERSYLLELWDKGICPNCGKKIPEGKRVGSGRKGDGGFCTLDCYGEYYQAELTDRHKRAIAAAEKYRNS